MPACPEIVCPLGTLRGRDGRLTFPGLSLEFSSRTSSLSPRVCFSYVAGGGGGGGSGGGGGGGSRRKLVQSVVEEEGEERRGEAGPSCAAHTDYCAHSLRQSGERARDGRSHRRTTHVHAQSPSRPPPAPLTSSTQARAHWLPALPCPPGALGCRRGFWRAAAVVVVVVF